jgi:hypothetical protein
MPTTVSASNSSSSLKLTDTSQAPQASSFAAALRSLAKNVSNTNVHSSSDLCVVSSSSVSTLPSSHHIPNSSSLIKLEHNSKEDRMSHSPSLSAVLGANDLMPTNPGVSASLLDVRKVIFLSYLQ